MQMNPGATLWGWNSDFSEAWDIYSGIITGKDTYTASTCFASTQVDSFSATGKMEFGSFTSADTLVFDMASNVQYIAVPTLAFDMVKTELTKLTGLTLSEFTPTDVGSQFGQLLYFKGTSCQDVDWSLVPDLTLTFEDDKDTPLVVDFAMEAISANVGSDCFMSLYDMGTTDTQVYLGMAFMEQFYTQVQYGSDFTYVTLEATPAANDMGTTISGGVGGCNLNTSGEKAEAWIIGTMVSAIVIGCLLMCCFRTYCKQQAPPPQSMRSNDVATLDSLDSQHVALNEDAAIMLEDD